MDRLVGDDPGLIGRADSIVLYRSVDSGVFLPDECRVGVQRATTMNSAPVCETELAMLEQAARISNMRCQETLGS